MSAGEGTAGRYIGSKAATLNVQACVRFPLICGHHCLAGWLLLILSGLLYGTGQLLLSRALAAAPAAIVTPFTYTQIVAAVLFGMLVLGELPDPWTFIGTALIVLAGLYVVRRTG